MGDLFSLAGRTAVVTGASSGLGARFAAVLAEAGATVYAAARRIDRLRALGPGIQAIGCDVAEERDRIRLAETVFAETGRFDVLVNNAGVPGVTLAEKESAADFAGVLAVNLVAPFHLARLMVEGRGDSIGSISRSIVNVASILGLVSTAPMGGAGYAASKAGLIGLTRELAGQWGAAGVRVNALAPGWFRSEMTGDLFADERSSRWVDRNTMLARGGESGELDGALLFLASDASSYYTGQVMVVDGGWTAR
jgi:NAD(P)-dependent dehydrogenase (short-subunit alcohol dehydrogenase family)